MICAGTLMQISVKLRCDLHSRDSIAGNDRAVLCRN
jgi:hypothetical protein